MMPDPSMVRAVSDALLPVYNRADLAFERGEGAWLTTTDGRRFLDFASGIAVTALGHAHPHLVSALVEQAKKLWHCSNMFRIPGQERLAERLCGLTFAEQAFFANSGAEAVECGIKIVRKYFDAIGQPERYRLIVFEGAFHGRTLATIAAGGNPKHLEGFEPRVDGFDRVPFGDAEAVRRAIGPQTAAVLLEPVQGEGGVRVAPPGFLAELRELCDGQGLLLFLDEVQTGMGRTGRLFAHEWAGIKPDVMAVAKGIGGGFPLSVCLATAKAAQGMNQGSHGSTYGGNPLGVAVGNAVLDVVTRQEFLAGVRARAKRFEKGLASLLERYPRVLEEQRGLGLLRGLKCRVKNADVLAGLREEGLLSVNAGENVVRLLPPLMVSDAEIDDALARIDRACARFGT
jgi:acetylornithine/N-succinyldiaminopimelate aminotransferase